MAILAVYDTVGIQDYIFNSNKLAENVGGSKLVADIFASFFPEIINSHRGVANWREKKELSLNSSCEIIYQGGGNAYVVFQDQPLFQLVTEQFLAEIVQKTRGVGLAVAAIETDLGDNYYDDMKKLNQRLALAKGNLNRPMLAGNQPITKQSVRTGSPVTAFISDENKEYIDVEQGLKRQRYEYYRKERKNSLGLVKTFDGLIEDTKGADSFIAIIHADGNNMGKNIGEIMSNFSSYEKAVPEIRELSKRIDVCYKEATEQVRESFPDIKVIELIGDGDDITLVLPGKYALKYAAELLKNIENTVPEKRPFSGVKPTACAGVVLFRAHYPFANAYKLAEECCASAKKLARQISTDAASASCIDFHLHSSGFVSDLETLREQQYVIREKSVLARPWCISKDEAFKDYPSFDWLGEHVGLKNWSRNKSKALRNAIAFSDFDADLVVNQAKSLGFSLPPVTFCLDDEKSKYAHYFDVLEIADLFADLTESEVKKHDDSDNA
ncbi:hypothetical protein LNN31_12690 [Acetobacterium wieringae]|uniref:Cas10/Cmr2 second palm domain-containing protein n=1 Tax=Acetobacterium wieringae TaxID=52694 RepID=A0ABY6HBB5_9FIRM|nr:hypothetical protein [Acetobacterium wieringae]UYO61637.1 hypothetical protein LNN31_12690 [Acetobacterium wieringae]